MKYSTECLVETGNLDAVKDTATGAGARTAKIHHIFWAVANGCPTCLTDDELKLHLECRDIILPALREHSTLTPAVLQHIFSNIDWLEDELQEIRQQTG